MSTDRIFVRFKGRTLGPFNTQRTQDLFRRGQITKLHELSSDGTTWVKADQFPLFATTTAETRQSDFSQEDGYSLATTNEYAVEPEVPIATAPSYLQPPVTIPKGSARSQRRNRDVDPGPDGERPEYWHPLDALIEAIREAFPPSISQTVATGTGNYGTYLLYLAQILIIVLGVFAAVRTDTLSVFLSFFGSAIGLLVLQYLAQKTLVASDVAIRSRTTYVSSFAITDCIAMLLIAATSGGFLYFLWVTISEGSPETAIAAFNLMVLGGYLTISTVHPTSLSIQEDPRTTLGETLLGIYSFIIRALLRSSAILYFSAILATLVVLAWNLLQLGINSSESTQLNTMVFVGYTGFFSYAILSAAAIPTVIYLATLLSYLLIDVLLAIISLPRKIDAAMGETESKGE